MSLETANERVWTLIFSELCLDGRVNRKAARLRDATPVQAEVAKGARSRDDEGFLEFSTAN
jgi:hypothetical protein